MNHQPKPVLVTTANRGVFAGLTTADYEGGDAITLIETYDLAAPEQAAPTAPRAGEGV